MKMEITTECGTVYYRRVKNGVDCITVNIEGTQYRAEYNRYYKNWDCGHTVSARKAGYIRAREI